MKLRRALVTVATTAAIAPAALMAAPAAFADASASPTATASATASDSPTPSSAPTTSAPSASATATTTPTASPTASPSPTGTATSTPTPQPYPTTFCDPSYKSAVQTSISGLPGKIVAGSGWHKFSITVTNPSNNTIKEIGLAAGITGTDARNPLPLSQVELQAYDENTHQWFDVTDDGQTAAGALGGGNLPGQTAWEFPVRLDVKSSAQIGKSLAVGIAGYPDTNNDCVVKSEVDYGIQIVAPGTSTTGSKPVEQTGGEIPVSKSSSSSTSNTVVPAADLSGSLAHTGAPSQLPMIAGIGGAAIVAGAGAMFVVRRRKAGSAA